MSVVAGIPVGNLLSVYQLTLPGYAGGVAQSAADRGRYLRNANTAFQTALLTNTFDASRMPYHQQLATSIYGGALEGLGDDVSPPPFTPSMYTSSGQPTQDTLDQVDAMLKSGDWLPGDNADDTSPAVDRDNGQSWWGDVLKAFAGPLAMGVGGRIAGVNPWAKPPVTPLSAGAMSSGVKLALIGGAALVGVYFLTRAAKRR